jgi:hypothetical protein
VLRIPKTLIRIMNRSLAVGLLGRESDPTEA